MTVIGLLPFLYTGIALSETTALLVSVVFNAADELFQCSASEIIVFRETLFALLLDVWSFCIGDPTDSLIVSLAVIWEGNLMSDSDSLVAMMNFRKVCASSKVDI